MNCIQELLKRQVLIFRGVITSSTVRMCSCKVQKKREEKFRDQETNQGKERDEESVFHYVPRMSPDLVVEGQE